MLPAERSLFIHFLGSELKPLIGHPLDSNSVGQALKILALGTSVPLYCPISSLWETHELTAATLRLISELVSCDILHTLGYAGSFDEFLTSRRTLYSHDRDRYPEYFEGRRLDLLRRLPTTDSKTSNTTSALLHSFNSWGSGLKLPGQITYLIEPENVIKPILVKALQQRDTQAITFSYFQPFLEKFGLSPMSTEVSVRTYIYLTYTNHYQSAANADIPTGFPGLSMYEKYLYGDFPFHDLPILADILKSCGLRLISDPRGLQAHEAWHSFGRYRGRDIHSRITTLIRIIIAAARPPIRDDKNADLFVIRDELRMRLGPYLITEDDITRPSRILETFECAESRLNHMIRKMKSERMMAAVIESSEHLIQPSCDILLVTATTVETTELLKSLRLYRVSPLTRVFFGEITFLDVGLVGAARVFIVQSEMGSGGPSGSTLTISDSIKILNPSSVILLGIAFGMRPARQRLGEILVSTQILPYEISRQGTDQRGRLAPVLRGDKPGASPRLLGQCKSAVLDWRGAPVSFGLLVSGEKMIDNVKIRDDLQQLCRGEALGGEMEGAGLYASAHRLKVDWIVIKAISDWADGHKAESGSRQQQTAAKNSARFVQHVLQQGLLASP